METNWNIDAMHSEIGFKVKHMMISNVRGKFAAFNAIAKTHGDDFSSAKFDFSAAINSIDTGVADRDAHLKSDDFFNAEKFPEMVFKSTGIEKKDDENFIINGELTIRNVTQPIALTAEFSGIVQDPYGQTKAGLSVNGKIKRSEYGLLWSAVTEAGKVVVSDDIHLNCDMQFVKEA
jgi:polyisoprenoid-binding protein YceI